METSSEIEILNTKLECEDGGKHYFSSFGISIDAIYLWFK
jgi:hypothetical protein